jgi:hypothetical protein
MYAYWLDPATFELKARTFGKQRLPAISYRNARLFIKEL